LEDQERDDGNKFSSRNKLEPNSLLTDEAEDGGNGDDDDNDVEMKSSSLTVHHMSPCRRMALIL
jgi:hypothetical protein